MQSDAPQEPTETSPPEPEPQSTLEQNASATQTATKTSSVFLPLATQSHPSIYYVAVTGNDTSGDGSALKPWASITHALTEVPDGAIISVAPGVYQGRVETKRHFEDGVTVRSYIPYMAQLRNDGQVISIFSGSGITFQGFDIAHSGEGASRYVIQIQDSEGLGLSGRDIVLRDNVIHDSYNNDLLKINNGASYITVEGNLFFNMGGPETDSHIDVNSVANIVIQDNIFMNDYAASGRANTNATGHFIVIKDSNEDDDAFLGSRDVTVRRNIFLNWEGDPGNSFIGLGDGTIVPYYQASGIMIENNLMIGNSGNKIHSALKITSGADITFRNNTVVGDMPANTYAFRLDAAGSMLNQDIRFFNNIWSDPTGTMGSEGPGDNNDFSDTPEAVISSFEIRNNLYWNGGEPVPFNQSDMINYTIDQRAMIQDPKLADSASLVFPLWSSQAQQFGDQFTSIKDVFYSLAFEYGAPADGSPVIDKADPDQAPEDDLLGRKRSSPDLGAVEWIAP